MSKPRIQLICNSCNNTRTANVRHTHDNHRNTSEAEFENHTELVKERLTLAYYIVKQEEYEVHMTSRQAMTKKRQGPPTQRILPAPPVVMLPQAMDKRMQMPAISLFLLATVAQVVQY